MRAKRDWERVRSPHARFLEGLQAAVANHPSASAGVRVNADKRAAAARGRLTVVGTSDNVIPMPTDRRRFRPKPAPPRGSTPAA